MDALPILAAGPLAHGGDPVIPWARIVLALLLCLALAVAAILALRYRQGRPADLGALLRGLVQPPESGVMPQLRVEERLRLSATSQVVVLHWDSARYLVHIAPGGAQLLDRQAVAEAAA